MFKLDFGWGSGGGIRWGGGGEGGVEVQLAVATIEKVRRLENWSREDLAWLAWFFGNFKMIPMFLKIWE
jgi:hypothetical protein